MSKSLEELIQIARKYRMTPEERDDQVRSFAYGNTHFENEDITRADIDQAFEQVRGGREPSRS